MKIAGSDLANDGAPSVLALNFPSQIFFSSSLNIALFRMYKAGFARLQATQSLLA